MAEPIEVRRYGTAGPTIVVLHGGPGAQGSAAGLARALEHRFRVLEPLQRRSGAVGLSVAQHVEDLAEVAPSRTILVGWSWGAMLGLSFAARHPDRVRALALIGCGAYSEAERAMYRKQMERRLGPEGQRQMDALARLVDAAADPRRRDRLFARMGQLATKAQSFELIEDGDDILTPDARGHHETWQDVLRLQREGIEPAAFAAIRSPVLMLHGDDDPHPGPATRDVLKRYIAHLDYLGLPRCGHEPWRERHGREPFLQALQDWLMSVAA